MEPNVKERNMIAFLFFIFLILVLPLCIYAAIQWHSSHSSANTCTGFCSVSPAANATVTATHITFQWTLDTSLNTQGQVYFLQLSNSTYGPFSNTTTTYTVNNISPGLYSWYIYDETCTQGSCSGSINHTTPIFLTIAACNPVPIGGTVYNQATVVGIPGVIIHVVDITQNVNVTLKTDASGNFTTAPSNFVCSGNNNGSSGDTYAVRPDCWYSGGIAPAGFICQLAGSPFNYSPAPWSFENQIPGSSGYDCGKYCFFVFVPIKATPTPTPTPTSPPTQTPTPTSTPTYTSTPSPTQAVTYTSTPTHTAVPTTITPKHTTTPTSTPKQTATPTSIKMAPTGPLLIATLTPTPTISTSVLGYIGQAAIFYPLGLLIGGGLIWGGLWVWKRFKMRSPFA